MATDSFGKLVSQSFTPFALILINNLGQINKDGWSVNPKQLTGVIRNKDNPRFGDSKTPTKEMITVNEELKLTIVRGVLCFANRAVTSICNPQTHLRN